MTNEKASEILFMQWQDFLEHNIDYAGISDAYKKAFEALKLIPDNATNGDVIKAMFPNADIEYWYEYSTYNVEFPNDNDIKHFSYNWWNAPYKKGEQE